MTKHIHKAVTDIYYHENGTATVTTVNIMSGNITIRTLPITEEQFNKWSRGNVNVQDAFPNLSAANRELLLTGIDDWDSLWR